MSLQAYLINRDQDTARLDFAMKSLSKVPGLAIERVSAVDGYDPEYDLAKAARGLLPNPPKTPRELKDRSTSAVFLSHATCWARIAKGTAPYGLVLEDDIEASADLAYLEQDLKSHAGFDLVFVNGRGGLYRKLYEKFEAASAFLPLDDFHQTLARRLPQGTFEQKFFNKDGAIAWPPGGDGYVMSRAGAEKMLRIASGMTYLQHVDMVLYALSVRPETYQTVSQSPRAFANIRAQQKTDETLNGYFAKKVYISHETKGVGGSVRLTWRDGNPQGGQAETQQAHSAKPSVTIHLGYHMTAATHLQAILNANADTLSDRFLILNRMNDSSASLRQACMSLHACIAKEEDDSAAISAIAKAAKGIRDKAIATNRSVVVSDEELAGFMVGRRNSNSIYPALEQTVVALRDGFAPLDVIFAVNEADDQTWLRKAHAYAVAHHLLAMSFDEFCEHVSGSNLLASATKRLVECVGEERVQVFPAPRKQAIPEDVNEQVSALLGTDDMSLDAPLRPQSTLQRLGPAGLELMREMNAQGFNWWISDKIRKVLERRHDLVANPPDWPERDGNKE